MSIIAREIVMIVVMTFAILNEVDSEHVDRGCEVCMAELKRALYYLRPRRGRLPLEADVLGNRPSHLSAHGSICGRGEPHEFCARRRRDLRRHDHHVCFCHTLVSLPELSLMTIVY